MGTRSGIGEGTRAPGWAPIIGVLTPLLSGAYFGEVLKGLSRHLAARGGRLVAVQTLSPELGDHYQGVPPFHMPAGWDQVDGFIVVIRAAPEEFLAELPSRGKPVVMVSHDIPAFACPRVLPDNRSGVEEAVSHLVGHGHERVAFVGDIKLPDVAERYEAYRATMRRHGLEPGRDLFFNAPDSCEEGGRAAGAEVLAAGVPCSAIVAGTDLTAAGLISALSAGGVDVPGELAVVGFDDMEFAAQLTPPLASVRQNFDRLTETAVRLVVDMVNGEPVENAEHRVATTLVRRTSCGCTRRIPTALAVPQLTPAQGLRANLFAALAEPEGAPEDRAALEALADEVVAVFKAGTPSEGDAALTRAAGGLFAAFPHHETVEAASQSLQQFRRDILRQQYSDERLTALDRCTGAVMAALHNAEVQSLAVMNETLESSLHNEYNVSMGLLGLREGRDGLRNEDLQAKSLDWLEATEARSACLALWEREAPEDELVGLPLRVTGTYGKGIDRLLPTGTKLDVTAFPPVEPLTDGYCGPGDIVFVLPVKTASRYWGLLAVTGPSRSGSKTGRDFYFQWAALLGTALDHEALVESLERQREDLADAYRRERELAEEIRASEERYALAASAANDGLWDWDLLSDTHYYSPRWKALLGYAEDEAGPGTDDWAALFHPEDLPRVKEVIWSTLQGPQSALETTFRVRARNGRHLWCLCRAAIVRGPDGRALRLVGSLTDITERKQLEDRLVQAAMHDSLTGLPNRHLFNDRLAQAMARAKRGPNYQFCVVFLDLDGFKAVNDHYGHVAGDALLVQVAARISLHLRENDTAVRFGGDEFAILLDDVSGPGDSQPIVDRLLEQLSAPYFVEGHEVAVSATAGTSLSSQAYETPEDMVRDADKAMYLAKGRRRRGGPRRPAPHAAQAS